MPALAAMVAGLAVCGALAVDHVFGEPPAWAHPVVWMGRYLGWLGPRMTAWRPGSALAGGIVAWCAGAAAVTAAASAAASAVASAAASAAASTAASAAASMSDAVSALSMLVSALLLALLLKPLLAWRLLHDEVAGVEAALHRSLDDGRARLQMLVSRDVAALDATQVRESAIESMAENLNDSVVAPLFWFAIGGLPAAALYRFANTADAMWGYRGRYEWVGKWAARADDALSWLPARLTALLLCVAAARRVPWAAARREARATPSPNGGWPMGVMALLLGVRLGKPGFYVLHAGGTACEPVHTRQALAWGRRVVILAAFVSMALGWAIGLAIPFATRSAIGSSVGSAARPVVSVPVSVPVRVAANAADTGMGR